MAHTKAYINLKIEKCQRLVDNSISEDQKKVYLGYLDFWSEKLPKKERPEEIAKKVEIQEAKAEAKDKMAQAIEEQKIKDLEKIAEDQRLLKEKAEKVRDLQAQLAALEATEEEIINTTSGTMTVGDFEELEAEALIESETLLAEDFEIEFAPKKAYRHQNGDKIKTIAFIEYLNQRTK